METRAFRVDEVFLPGTVVGMVLGTVEYEMVDGYVQIKSIVSSSFDFYDDGSGDSVTLNVHDRLIAAAAAEEVIENQLDGTESTRVLEFSAASHTEKNIDAPLPAALWVCDRTGHREARYPEKGTQA